MQRLDLFNTGSWYMSNIFTDLQKSHSPPCLIHVYVMKGAQNMGLTFLYISREGKNGLDNRIITQQCSPHLNVSPYFSKWQADPQVRRLEVSCPSNSDSPDTQDHNTYQAEWHAYLCKRASYLDFKKTASALPRGGYS